MQFLLLENIHPVAREILSAAGFTVATESTALKESEANGYVAEQHGKLERTRFDGPPEYYELSVRA